MAKALDYAPRPPTSQERLASEVEDSTDALLEGLELLRVLHDHGVLNVLGKTVRGGEGLTASLLQILGGSGGTTFLRNVSELSRTLGTLDPREVGLLSHALTTGVAESARHVASGRGIGLGELMGLLKDRDVQVALGAILALLKGMGRALREANGETQENANQAEVSR
ncbi:DUF1641 domain-containing protein [Deinococcus sp. HMF7604]|uniref:DUF1641 domain-containing protein n=1 Tax=Deinococcus betulae TaxID=2873312 RepID=UPI001CCC3321|nr:DUF1641 domain-containing protein [Deinococcus betulae]MBZ9749416.1 DUF1641 domain-containing protein [Deinococcus betulae]